MQLTENLYTRPTESLRFGYTHDEIAARVRANIEACNAYIEKQIGLALLWAKKSESKREVTIENLMRWGRSSKLMDLRFEAQMACYYAGLVQVARARKALLEDVRDHGVFVHFAANAQGAQVVALSGSEYKLLVCPLNPEENWETHSLRPRGTEQIPSFEALDDE